PGIRWVRIDRASGKPVFGQFPTSEDPQSPVIWEAFQPQTETQHGFHSSIGDPYNPASQPQVQQPQPLDATDQTGPAQQAPRPRRAAPAATAATEPQRP